jgi:hypothetical protein
MSLLTPCPECRRHVRKTETQCPFCGEAVSLAHVPAPALPRKRLGRAATFAFGASVIGATSLVACSDGDDQSPGTAVYGAPPGGSSYAGSAVYGAPPSGSSTGGNNNADAGAATAVYGAPAAGSGNDAPGGNGGAGGEAGAPTEGGNGGEEAGAAPLYGGPPSGTGGV